MRFIPVLARGSVLSPSCVLWAQYYQCSFLIASSVFSSVYLSRTQRMLGLHICTLLCCRWNYWYLQMKQITIWLLCRECIYNWFCNTEPKVYSHLKKLLHLWIWTFWIFECFFFTLSILYRSKRQKDKTFFFSFAYKINKTKRRLTKKCALQKLYKWCCITSYSW